MINVKKGDNSGCPLNCAAVAPDAIVITYLYARPGSVMVVVTASISNRLAIDQVTQTTTGPRNIKNTSREVIPLIKSITVNSFGESLVIGISKYT